MTVCVNDTAETTASDPDSAPSEDLIREPRQKARRGGERGLQEVTLCFYALLERTDLEDAFGEFVVPEEPPPAALQLKSPA